MVLACSGLNTILVSEHGALAPRPVPQIQSCQPTALALCAASSTLKATITLPKTKSHSSFNIRLSPAMDGRTQLLLTLTSTFELSETHNEEFAARFSRSVMNDSIQDKNLSHYLIETTMAIPRDETSHDMGLRAE